MRGEVGRCGQGEHVQRYWVPRQLQKTQRTASEVRPPEKISQYVSCACVLTFQFAGHALVSCPTLYSEGWCAHGYKEQ